MWRMWYLMDAFDPKKDYCTGFPDSVFDKSIKKCCAEHDEAYEKVSFSDKLRGDVKLYKCVKKESYTIVAIAMFSVVVTVGTLFWVKARLTRHFKR